MVAIPVGIDWITKAYVRELPSPIHWGPITIANVDNPGLMLGAFSSIPNGAKIGLQTATTLLLIGGYILFELLFKIKSAKLKYGILLLLGGILGNTLDRFFFGAVSDFIVLSFSPRSHYALNVADIVLLIGLCVIVYALLTDFREYWARKEVRNSLIINRDLQYRLSLVFAMISLVSSFIGLALGMSFTYSFLDASTFGLFCILGGMFCLILATLAFGAGIIISHRFAGPLYAIGKFLRSTLDGEHKSLKLRSTDEFQELEEKLNEINKKLSAPKAEE